MLICSTLTMIEGNPVLKNMIQIYWLALANKCLRGMKKTLQYFPIYGRVLNEKTL
ncbi:hypothetical protein BRLA_c024900 [Brevibacillus laterosporus LMG 15441]|uniref:Uncharacterized protein n=1 Tax=Brevibacillus laterosporus LMG 15441 TaxID=1042163 RepID=A0A075RBD3_BRELA|nr:hypothetical protein BRLA_c024900 [Brevibacillus laterosporus LMG 15441]